MKTTSSPKSKVASRSKRSSKASSCGTSKDTCCESKMSSQSSSCSHATTSCSAGKTKKGSATAAMVVVRADVGWGNSLYVRGEGAGLSWDKGVLMENKSPTEWVWAPSSASTFKLLVNDEKWSEGENMSVQSGQKLVLEPCFS